MDNNEIISDLMMWLQTNVEMDTELYFDDRRQVDSQDVLTVLSDMMGIPTGIATTPEQYCARFTALPTHPAAQLSYVYVSDKKMMATNGHFGCIVDTELANGYYDPTNGGLQKINVPFPDLTKVIPAQVQLDSEITVTISEQPTIVEGLRNKITLVDIGGRKFDKRYINMVANGESQLNVRLSHSKATPSVFSVEGMDAQVFGLSMEIDNG